MTKSERFFTCRLYKDDHPLLMEEPLNELDEGGDDGGVPDLLDDQDREGRLVPGQPLRGRILDCPAKKFLLKQL